MVNRALTLAELREDLARAEQEFACAEFIDQTSRQQSERMYWAAEITRLRMEISQRGDVRRGTAGQGQARQGREKEESNDD